MSRSIQRPNYPRFPNKKKSVGEETKLKFLSLSWRHTNLSTCKVPTHSLIILLQDRQSGVRSERAMGVEYLLNHASIAMKVVFQVRAIHG